GRQAGGVEGWEGVEVGDKDEGLRLDRRHRERAQLGDDRPRFGCRTWVPVRDRISDRMQHRDGAGTPPLRRPDSLTAVRPLDGDGPTAPIEVTILQTGELAG